MTTDALYTAVEDEAWREAVSSLATADQAVFWLLEGLGDEQRDAVEGIYTLIHEAGRRLSQLYESPPGH